MSHSITIAALLLAGCAALLASARLYALSRRRWRQYSYASPHIRLRRAQQAHALWLSGFSLCAAGIIFFMAAVLLASVWSV